MGEVQARKRNSRTATASRVRQHDSAGSNGHELDFEDFFENGGIACHMVSADGTVLRANETELDLLGYAPEEYIGRPIAEFHVDRPVIEDILARLKSGERLHKHPARLCARDGSIRNVEITSSGRFRNGRFVNTRCFTVDVTELARAREGLRRKDEELRQVLDALPAAVYRTDAAGRITYYNRAAAELAGREPQIGRDQWCVSYRLRTPDGADLPLEDCPMATTLKENRPVRGVEALAQRPDGTLVPFLPFPTPLHDEKGELVGAVNMLVDISARKQAEAHQRMLLDELNHRVKNNMQMLHGLLQSALRETGNPEAQAVIRNASQRVSAMAAAQQLLYSESDPRSFSMGEFLNAVCGSARQTFHRDVALHFEADEGRLSNDVSMPLALILNELLTNAAKHGVSGDDRGEIAVALRQDGDEVVLSVTDGGCGFDPQQTAPRSSGLGLVRGLSRQLGGAFSVERGAGARCIVRFPASPCHALT